MRKGRKSVSNGKHALIQIQIYVNRQEPLLLEYSRWSRERYTLFRLVHHQQRLKKDALAAVYDFFENK